jgi:hypothetical protein
MVADDKTTPGLSSCEFSKVNEERVRKRKRSQDEGNAKL